MQLECELTVHDVLAESLTHKPSTKPPFTFLVTQKSGILSNLYVEHPVAIFEVSGQNMKITGRTPHYYIS